MSLYHTRYNCGKCTNKLNLRTQQTLLLRSHLSLPEKPKYKIFKIDMRASAPDVFLVTLFKLLKRGESEKKRDRCVAVAYVTPAAQISF
jgi:hypothetical protein